MLIEHSLSSFHNCHIKSSTKGKPREPFTLHCMHINEAGSRRVVFEAIGGWVGGGNGTLSVLREKKTEVG